MPISRSAYTRGRSPSRAVRDPTRWLPRARPPMKAASTVLTASEVAPNRWPRRRAQTTSWTSPAAPETRKTAPRTGTTQANRSAPRPASRLSSCWARRRSRRSRSRAVLAPAGTRREAMLRREVGSRGSARVREVALRVVALRPDIGEVAVEDPLRVEGDEGIRDRAIAGRDQDLLGPVRMEEHQVRAR